jgi:hypothetical protein
MQRYISKYLAILALSAGLLSTISCKKDYLDPSKAPEDPLFSSSAGITGVTVGLQRVYSLGRASSLYNIVSTTGLVTHELTLLNQGNLPEAQLSAGAGSVDGTNTILAGLWTSSNKIVYDANKVIQATSALTDKGYASGLIGHATIFKALSLAAMAMFWEKVPAANGTNVTFITNTEGFTKAIAAIDSALGVITANPISATFITNVPAGIDIVNTLQALKARYSLYIGNYAQALAAANSVDLTKKSTLNFEAANPNPIYDAAGSNFNVYQPIDSTMGLPAGLRPDLGDKRVSFYMALSGSPASRFVMKGFSSGSTVSVPVYLPGEITLIKAESYIRQATPDLANATAELNKIVTKKPAADPFGVGADLPALSTTLSAAQLLDQVYLNRSVELYMSGLKLQDMRRFGRPNAERTRNLMPYPFRERDNNNNTPPDPTF